MTRPVEQPEAELAPTPNAENSNGHTFASMLEGLPSARRAAADQLERVGFEGDGRKRISLAGAAFMALLGSVLTAIYVRRQARARARKLAWLAFRAGAGRMMPAPRQIAPVGGAGASLLLASLLLARRRHAQAETPVAAAEHRLAAFQSQLGNYRLPHQPHLGDVLLGVALGMGAANLRPRRGRS